MKKVFAVLGLLAILLISFGSCRNEEIIGNTENSKKQLQLIKSKSLWKENEKFINSIYNHFEKSVVPNEISKNNFLSKYGNINWDYAMTFGVLSKNYLVAPVFRFGKITGAVKAQVKKNTVIYSYTEDKKIIQMFFDVIYTPRHKIKPNADKVKGSNAISRYDYVCVERSMSVWLNEGSGETPKWGTRYYQSCSWDWTDDIVPTDPLMYNCEECGQSGGGSGGSDDSNENTDPCSKIKSDLSNSKFKEKMSSLNNSTVLNYDHEMGFAASYPPLGTGITDTQYQPLDNKIGTHSVRLPDGDRFFGFIHTHNNAEGVIKIFSPADVMTFLTSCVPNANMNGSINDAFAMVITSEGSYMLKYTGTNYDFGNLASSLSNWNSQYKNSFGNALIENDGYLNQSTVENIFLQFLKNTVNIDGLELYKVDENSSEELSLNSNNTTNTTPCP